MDRIQCMAVFVATVEMGSISAAARVLGLSAAVVARYLQHLEDELDISLFEQKGRWQRLSAAGVQYNDQCRAILALVREAEGTARTLDTDGLGVLRVQAPVAFGAYRLAVLVAEFGCQYPHYDVELVLADEPCDPYNDDIDVTFVVGDDDLLQDGAWVVERLQDQALCFAAAPAYLQKHGTPQTMQDLVRHRCLGKTPSRDELMDNEALDVEESVLAPPMTLKSNNMHALQAAAVSGAGLVLLPRGLLEPDLQAGRLQEVPLLNATLSESLHVVTFPEDHDDRVVQSFLDFVRPRVAEVPVGVSAVPL